MSPLKGLLEEFRTVGDVAVVHHLGGESSGPLDHELGLVAQFLLGQLEPCDPLLHRLGGDGDCLVDEHVGLGHG